MDKDNINSNNLCPHGNENSNSVTGCLYTDIVIPGHIVLDDGRGYALNFSGKPVFISLIRHWNPLQILDFENDLIDDINNKKMKLKHTIEDISDQNIILKLVSPYISKVYDYKEDRKRWFTPKYYTEFLIAYEIDNVNNLTDKHIKFSEDILNYFLDVYRVITKDVKIKRTYDLQECDIIYRVSAIKYTDEELKLTEDERVGIERKIEMGIKQIRLSNDITHLPNINPEQVFYNNREILKFLHIENREICTEEELIVKALEEYQINKNYKYALLNVFMAAEIIIMNYVTEIKRKKGVSNNKLKEYKGEVGISYVINMELPLIIENFNENEKKILGNVDKVRKKRNKVMHEGEKVEESDAKLAIEAIFKLMAFLKNKV